METLVHPLSHHAPRYSLNGLFSGAPCSVLKLIATASPDSRSHPITLNVSRWRLISGSKPSFSLTESELVGVAEKFRAGHITAATYFQSIQTPENLKFVANYKSRFGADDVPCVYSETAYVQVLLYTQALAKAGDESPAAIARALASMTMMSPQGLISIDSETNHTNLLPRIGRSNKAGLFDILWQATEADKPDPYLVSNDRTIAAGQEAGMTFNEGRSNAS